MSGPGPAQAAQRNYLQSLHGEVAAQGVYVGMLYIGAAIEGSAFHTELERAKAAGEPVWEMASVDPAVLAEMLWSMHRHEGRGGSYLSRAGSLELNAGRGLIPTLSCRMMEQAHVHSGICMSPTTGIPHGTSPLLTGAHAQGNPEVILSATNCAASCAPACR